MMQESGDRRLTDRHLLLRQKGRARVVEDHQVDSKGNARDACPSDPIAQKLPYRDEYIARYSGSEVVKALALNKHDAVRASRNGDVKVNLKVDNGAVRQLQIDKLTRLKRERDPQAAAEALTALTRNASGGNGNLLALAVDAARAKATVGEISLALEQVFGRHQAEIKTISGVYRREVGMADAVERMKKRVAEFEDKEGRRPRILVAKIGQDGHDRGQKVIASAFADLGFDVDIGPLFATPAEAARQAVENDVHILGISSLAGAHLTLVPELKAELGRNGRSDIMIVVGGVVPPQDYEVLKTAGAEAIFPPGTVIAEAAESLLGALNRRLGHSRAAAE
jgi:methylmalonyl-CoA mutase